MGQISFTHARHAEQGDAAVFPVFEFFDRKFHDNILGYLQISGNEGVLCKKIRQLENFT